MSPPTQAAIALKRSCALLVGRLEALEARVQAGDETAWPVYLATLSTLAAITPNLAPGAFGDLTTKEMAERLGVAPKTVLKWRKTGKLGGARKYGARGRAAIRWTSDGNAGGNARGK